MGSCHILVEYGTTAKIPRDREILLFSKLRNELLRLPAFLRHYRNLGVSQFFLVDNDSSDGTSNYLSSQHDVRLFRTKGRFREARGGTDWLNELLHEFGCGSWCVTVDIDELLYYPGCESVSLTTLTSYFDERGYQALGCLLLDMYPGIPLSECSYVEGQEFLEAAPFFDVGPYTKIPVDQCPGYLIRGGVRERMFYPEFRARGVCSRLLSAFYNRIASRIPVLRSSSWLRATRPKVPPCLTKVPLVLWDKSSEYLDVNHFVSPRRVAPETGVLLHFKFLPDFHRKAVVEAHRGEYYEGGAEYQQYAVTLATSPNLTLMSNVSRRFEGTEQLIQLGLIQDTNEWSTHRDRADKGSYPGKCDESL